MGSKNYVIDGVSCAGKTTVCDELETLNRRLAARPADAWGGSARDGEAFARFQHATQEGLPTNAIIINATAPLARIVDTILDHA